MNHIHLNSQAPDHPGLPAPQLPAYLRVLATDCRPGQFFDVRWSIASGEMRRRFIATPHIHQTVLAISSFAPHTDVYIGVALRDRRDFGGKSAISGSRLLYIECDQPDAEALLEDFPHAPAMIVASGSPGHLHIYWLLHHLATVAEVESANRRLALALNGDPASVDIARILRPPETINHKHMPPLPVRLVQLDPDARHGLTVLTADLPADPQPVLVSSRGAPASRKAHNALDRALLAIPAAEYVRVLANRVPNRAGKVLCPFHQERTASLQLYPDGTFYCYGRHGKIQACGKGGTIFDFAAATWHLDTKGDDFLELRRRLALTFGLTPASRRKR